VAPSVLSQRYGDAPKPDVERDAATVEAKAFAIASKSVAAKSPSTAEEEAAAVPD
jgi:hypothetical protein